ncbi:hypothetical protein JT359_10210 [Candidatus Poribacteria bacterium]|nr:hypothetical protein [Candidatus Poribacteria bacterium]
MALATTLYFPEVGPQWEDWIQVINVGNEQGRVTGLARHAGNGQPTWTEEKELGPFECWTPNVEAIKQNSSMQLTSDQPIVAERHMHNKTNILDFVGAAFEYETVGQRLFFPELVAGALDWFRFFNVGEADAFVNIIIRNRQGDIIHQQHRQIKPFCCWDVAEGQMGNVTGTVEVQSSQPIVGERHLHYQGGKTCVGQYGQVISDAPKTLYFPEVGPAWQDWSIIVNVGKERARVTLIAHDDGTGDPVTTMEHDLNPYECWTPRMDDIKVKSSILLRCDQPIVAERHMHNETAVIDLPGASVEGGHVGLRLFFPEVASGARDWFRFLNVGEADAFVNIILRNKKGQHQRTIHRQIKPRCCADVDEAAMGNIRGTVEAQSSQPIVGERHLHYQSGHKGSVVGEYGVVIGE